MISLIPHDLKFIVPLQGAKINYLYVGFETLLKVMTKWKVECEKFTQICLYTYFSGSNLNLLTQKYSLYKFSTV